MASFPELVCSTEQDKRIYTINLFDENHENRDISDQNIRLVIADPWNNKKLLDVYGEILTTNPAVVKFTLEDSEIPPAGYYVVKVYIEEHTDPEDTDTDLEYREPYRQFKAWIEQGLDLAPEGP